MSSAYPGAANKTADQLDREANNWEATARKEQRNGNPLMAQFARDNAEAARIQAHAKRA